MEDALLERLRQLLAEDASLGAFGRIVYVLDARLSILARQAEGGARLSGGGTEEGW